MRSRSIKGILAMAVIFMVAMLAWSIYSVVEPEYHGKSAIAWLRELSFPPIEGDSAETALVKMGAKAVPDLARHAGGPKTLLDKIRDWIGSKLPPVLRANWPAPDDWRVRVNAARVLGRIGPDARAAVPALRTALNDPQQSVRFFAVEALGKIGDESRATVDALIATLRSDRDSAVRLEAADALGRVGSAATNALPRLLELLEAEDSHTWRTAATAVLAIDPKKVVIVHQALRARGCSPDEFLVLQTHAEMKTIGKDAFVGGKKFERNAP
jgi:hypothetical protein